MSSDYYVHRLQTSLPLKYAETIADVTSCPGAESCRRETRFRSHNCGVLVRSFWGR